MDDAPLVSAEAQARARETLAEHLAGKKPSRPEFTMRRLQEAAEKWKERLIDASRRNILLFFRPLARGTLDLGRASDALVQHLLVGKDISLAKLLEITDGKATPGRLKEIRSVALSNREERGLDTLYIALGLATWHEEGAEPVPSWFSEPGTAWAAPRKKKSDPDARDDEDEVNADEVLGFFEPEPAGLSQVTAPKASPSSLRRAPVAPVILMPAQIVKSGNGYTLSGAGEPTVNPVLLFWLAQHFNVALDAGALLGNEAEGSDDLREDEELNPQAVFDRLQAKAGTIRDFRVADRVLVGNFSFQKMAMVRDLEDSVDTMAESDVLCALVGDPAARDAIARQRALEDPRELDTLPVNDLPLVINADASQQLAIYNIVRRGVTAGVIHGPPGTGKSQTIANAIACLAAAGQRVLFVAEKRAALDAVYDRLKKVGLDHLVLDLHSADTKRSKVAERLKRALEVAVRASSTDTQALTDRITDLRGRLRNHAERVNAIYPELGTSFNELLGNLLATPDDVKSELRWNAAELERLTPDAVNRLVERVTEAASFGSLFVRDGSSAWFGATFVDGAQAQSALELARDIDTRLLPALNEAVNNYCASNGTRIPLSVDGAAALCKAADSVNAVLALYHKKLLEEDLDGMSAAAKSVRPGAVFHYAALCTNTRYRKALSTLKRHRRSRARHYQRLLGELESARDARRRWQESSDRRPSGTTAIGPVSGALVQLGGALDRLGRILGRVNFRALDLGGLTAYISSLKNSPGDAQRMVRVCAIERELRDAGIARFVDELRQRPRPQNLWPESFKWTWRMSMYDQLCASYPDLASFNGEFHTTLIQEFQRKEPEQFASNAHLIRGLHADAIMNIQNAQPEPWRIVKKEMNKKKGHASMRSLVTHADKVITTLCPCFVASPLSVANLFDAQRLFDVVIFDEASQVTPEDAISAIMRGTRVFVAGDEFQLPPTPFFVASQGDEEDDDSEADLAEAPPIGHESILDMMKDFVSGWLLNTHYRSEDERLIALSNQEIYKWQLVTFPGIGRDTPLSHVYVNAVAREEKSLSVAEEVEKVVDLILEHAAERPSESLGVTTMSISHMRRIDRALDERRKELEETNPGVEQFFSDAKPEPFFIKNLERVQGDERDAIIISMGYAKDKMGRLSHNFGPINAAGGERRLNVAITRARKRMTLVSAFTDLDIDLTKTDANRDGPKLLRQFFEYMRTGGESLTLQGGPTHEKMNVFEFDVYTALTKTGIPLVPQFGVSTYRLDFAARHPDQRGRYVLAIECDGASYHRIPTVRERDRIRQRHLERLGWRFYRIWSTDWFRGREHEIANATAAYREALVQSPTDASIRDPAEQNLTSESIPPGAIATRGVRPNVYMFGPIDSYRDKTLLELVRWCDADVVRHDDDELVDLVAREIGYARKTKKFVNRIRELILIYRGELRKASQANQDAVSRLNADGPPSREP